MRNLLVEKWEKQLKTVFDKIDDMLEEKFGHLFPLHPSRSARHEAANKEDGGLFDVTPAFTAGVASPTGPGDFFRIRWATLSYVPEDLRSNVEEAVLHELQQSLPGAFPGKNLQVVREGAGFKIIGDLSLD